MRVDTKMDRVRFARDPEALCAFLGAGRLGYARFETALAQKFFATVDLVFSEGGRVALVPWIVVDGPMLLERELSPFIWPAYLRGLDPDAVEEIEARIEPWLRARLIARNENGEDERFFLDDASFAQRVRYAKERGWLCAARSIRVLREIAPHAYAERFVPGSAIVRGTGAANGAAFLAVANRETIGVLESERDVEAAKTWFDFESFRLDAPRSCDVYVGPRAFDPGSPTALLLDDVAAANERSVGVATPLPIEVMLSYDLDDAGEASRFCVRSRPRPARSSHVTVPSPAGGSGGRIALVAREDVLRVRDADSDAILALHAMLSAEGFDANIVTPSHFQCDGFDLVHVFGYRFAGAIAPQIARAAAAGIPIAVTPYADDPQGELALGTGTMRRLLQNSDDETQRSEYLHALARRRLRDEEPVALVDFASVTALCSAANVAFVTCAREEMRLRQAFSFAGVAVHTAAIAFPAGSGEDPSFATGYRDFALVSGAIAPEGNTYLIARAAARLGIPLVVCGDVTDAAYYPEVRAVLDRTGIWLPAKELPEAAVRSLAARARVVLDVSWSGYGLHRLATAACTGAAIVGSAAGYAGDVWGDGVHLADPASEESIAMALSAAWLAGEEHRRALVAKTVPLSDPLTALLTIVQGYQQAAKGPDTALT